MLKKYAKFNVLFGLIAISHLIATFTGAVLLANITKPLIVISLIVMLAISTSLKGRFHKRLCAGLIFSLIGDILLMFVAQGDSMFLYGLLAFLICHILYISAFYLDFRSAPDLDKKTARFAILLCSLAGMGFYLYIRPNLGALRLPVMAYTFVICFMIMMATFRNLRVNAVSFKLILSGAIIFALSDCLLGINKFVQPFDHAHVLIMATYVLAQYLITIGAIERKLISVQ